MNQFEIRITAILLGISSGYLHCDDATARLIEEATGLPQGSLDHGLQENACTAV